MATARLLIFGLGYTGTAIARAAVASGWRVTGTRRFIPPAANTPAATSPAATAATTTAATGPAGVAVIGFTEAATALADATHCLTTAGTDASTDAAGDPVLARYADAIAAAPRLRWIGYLSTTGVYGNRAGAMVDETTPPAPGSARTAARVAAEHAWAAFATKRAVDLFRLAGIYGPGRSPFDALRAGTARHIAKPGHAFSRIHRDDIAGAVLAAMRQSGAPGVRVLNLADDEPCESASVIQEAARLLGIAPPPVVPFDLARLSMTPMALSFWAENRRVDSRATQQALGYRWRYPSYREGLRAILAEERGERPV